jgi:hypothetical protein
MSSSHWMFCVTSPRLETSVLEQSRGQQRLLARPLAAADVEEEPEQERRADRQQHRHQRDVVVGLQDPEHDAEHADGGQDRAERIERPVGSAGSGSTTGG